MVTMVELIQFFLTILIIMLLPGADLVLIISSAISRKVSFAFLAMIGAVTGVIFHIVLVAITIHYIITLPYYVFLALKILGSMYLFWLGLMIYKSEFSKIKDNNLSGSGVKIYSLGFLTNLLNPKALLLSYSIFPLFIKSDPNSLLAPWMQVLVLGAILIIIKLSVEIFILMVVLKLRSYSFFENKTKFIQKLSGIMLALMGVRIIFLNI